MGKQLVLKPGEPVKISNMDSVFHGSTGIISTYKGPQNWVFVEVEDILCLFEPWELHANG